VRRVRNSSSDFTFIFEGFPVRILLQLPEGLKSKAFKLAEKLERGGNEVVVSCSPCYGACDVAVEEALRCKADRIIQYGHSSFPVRSGIPVKFVEYRTPMKFRRVLSKAVNELRGFEKVGLVTTVQHIGQLSDIKKFLEGRGKKVFVGKHSRRTRYDGQILGCDVGSVKSIERKVDCFLYFGGGVFHALGGALATEKPFLAVDPFTRSARWMEEERRKELGRRRGALLAAFEARRFGIICSIKSGQFNLKAALGVRELLERSGRTARILICDEVNYESLNNFLEIDCFVNTACPRIAEDCDRVRRPILGVEEVKKIIKLKKEN
jgi:2-(3-amino-3-carboxypropyl)histidine synthase